MQDVREYLLKYACSICIYLLSNAVSECLYITNCTNYVPIFFAYFDCIREIQQFFNILLLNLGE